MSCGELVRPTKDRKEGLDIAMDLIFRTSPVSMSRCRESAIRDIATSRFDFFEFSIYSSRLFILNPANLCRILCTKILHEFRMNSTDLSYYARGETRSPTYYGYNSSSDDIRCPHPSFRGPPCSQPDPDGGNCIWRYSQAMKEDLLMNNERRSRVTCGITHSCACHDANPSPAMIVGLNSDK